MTEDSYTRSYFDARAPDAQARQAMRVQEYERVRSRLSDDAGTVLDIGCGEGEFLELFDTDRWHRLGIEVSGHAIEVCTSKGISFDVPRDQDGWCDVVVLRGSLQHLDRPVATLWDCHRWLKPGGLLSILATPNAGSIVYRLFQELPPLVPELNFVVFSARELSQCLRNIGYREVELVYPYRETPYASLLRDHWRFLLRLVGIRRPFAFWGNQMECYARR